LSSEFLALELWWKAGKGRDDRMRSLARKQFAIEVMGSGRVLSATDEALVKALSTACDSYFESIAGRTVASIRRSLATLFSIPTVGGRLLPW
jgi:hypothetical protein